MNFHILKYPKFINLFTSFVLNKFTTPTNSSKSLTQIFIDIKHIVCLKKLDNQPRWNEQSWSRILLRNWETQTVRCVGNRADQRGYACNVFTIRITGMLALFHVCHGCSKSVQSSIARKMFASPFQAFDFPEYLPPPFVSSIFLS